MTADDGFSTVDESPFDGWMEDGRRLYLFRAAELSAIGLLPGLITDLAFDVTSTPFFAGFYLDFEIKMSCKNDVEVTNNFPVVGGWTSVYQFPVQNVNLGTNWFGLDTPFYWDGSSNIYIHVCYDNTLSLTESHPVSYQTTPFRSCLHAYDSGVSGCSMPAISSSFRRPKTYFAQSVSLSPQAGEYVEFSNGVVVGAPTNDYMGPGSINAEAVYDDGTVITDYVFDRYYDGKVRDEDVLEHGAFEINTIDEMHAHTREKRHLPTIEGRDEWERKGQFSLGELTNQLWATVEVQALYIAELHERLKQLEAVVANGSQLPVASQRKAQQQAFPLSQPSQPPSTSESETHDMANLKAMEAIRYEIKAVHLNSELPEPVRRERIRDLREEYTQIELKRLER